MASTSSAVEADCLCAGESWSGGRKSSAETAIIEGVLKGRTLGMNFRIEIQPAIKITGLPIRVSMNSGRDFEDIPAFWNRAMNDGSIKKLQESVPEGSKLGVIGVSTIDYDEKTREFTYLIGIESPLNRSRLPDGCVDTATEAGTWAVFESRGSLPDAIQKTWKWIISEWFATSGYHRRDGADLEIYGPGDTNSPDYYCEVWIPVVN